MKIIQNFNTFKISENIVKKTWYTCRCGVLIVGFLVIWTQHPDNDKVHNYREHLFQYSYSGHLLAVLPFLRRSRSSLCVVYLDKDTDTTNRYPTCGREGWYLYLQDGRQGVMCVRLAQDQQWTGHTGRTLFG